MHVHLLLGFWSVSIIFMVISLVCTIVRIIRKNKYGKAVFKISSRNYKRGLKSKEMEMEVAPFKEGNVVYLPLKYVASSLGICFESVNGEDVVIRYDGKTIKLNEEHMEIQRNDIYVFQTYESHSKVVNGQMMVPTKTLKDMFGLNVEFKNDTQEIILR